LAAFFEMVFDIPADHSFTYLIDDKAEAAAGKRAMVPSAKGTALDTLSRGVIIRRRA